MNKIGKRILACLCSLILMLSLAFDSVPAFAAEEESEETAFVYVTGYEVSGKSVIPGSDFTLTLTLKNVSSVAAENVTVSITNPSGVAPEYGAVSNSFVGTIAAGGTKKVSVKYSSNSNVSEDSLKFSVNVTCDGKTTGTEVRVPVGEKAQVFVTGCKASKQPVMPGEDFNLTITLKNYSKDSAAENVVVTLNNPSGVVPQYGTVCVAQVASIKANSTAEVTFSLTSDKNISASNLSFTVGVLSNTGSSSTQLSVPVKEAAEVGVTGYEVTKQPVVPGDNFTITLFLKNFSKETTAKNVKVTMSNPSGVIPEYGTVNTARIASIAPNATAKVAFTFSATADLTANELYFTAVVNSDSESSSIQISIPVRKLAQLYVEGYEVTNETIIPGSDFALKVRIKNHSENVTVKDAVIVINSPTGVIPEYGKVGTAFIESLAPNETEEICFRYSSNSGIKGSELNFGVGVFYDNLSTSAQIRIPVGKMTDFSVEESSIPENMVVGTVGYASAMIENLEDTGVSNVVMVARCNGKDIASANIGTISAKTFKTQSVSLVFEEEGQYAVDLLLTYTNGEGENKEYTISSSIIKVVKEEEAIPNGGNDTPVQTDNPEILPEKGNSNLLLLSVSGILLIGLCCVILILLYRRKK